MKPRVIRMASAVDYINSYLMQKGVDFNEIADVCDKLISFEIQQEEPINEEELDKLAIEEANKFPLLNPKEGKCVAFYKGFKAGYLWAKA